MSFRDDLMTETKIKRDYFKEKKLPIFIEIIKKQLESQAKEGYCSCSLAISDVCKSELKNWEVNEIVQFFKHEEDVSVEKNSGSYYLFSW